MKHIKADLGESQHTFPIALIVSQFNHDITHELQNGAVQRLKEAGFSEEQMTLIEVPGAIEIPLIAKKLAKKNYYGALIALGAVIRGETTHYDYVCAQVSEGCQHVALSYDIPVVFGVLTTENEAQAWDRLGGKQGHKGVDAAECALSMYAILKQL